MAGAAYLLFTGLQMLLSRRQPIADLTVQGGEITLRRVFWQGALTNVLNPKVALFFLAFLPQFVAADSPHKTLAFLLLGLIFIFNGTLWCLGDCGIRGDARPAVIRQSQGVIAWINRVLGRTVRLSRHPRRDAGGALNSRRFERRGYRQQRD